MFAQACGERERVNGGPRNRPTVTMVRRSGNHHDSIWQDPTERVLDALRRMDCAPKKRERGWQARCPSHKDKKASLDIATGHDGRALIHCKAGCSAESIVRALGLKMGHLFVTTPSETERLWDIRDVDGNPIAEHVRKDLPDGDKRIWFRRNGSYGLHGLPMRSLPLYGAHLLKGWDDGSVVVVCEGEKAADAVREAGLQAVGTVCGASTKPDREILEPLTRFDVVLWPDADALKQRYAGQRHMLKIASVLAGLGCTPRWVHWADAPPKGDAADTTAEHVRELVQAATEEPVVIPDDPVATHEPAVTVQPLIDDRHTEGGAGDLFADQHHNGLRYCRALGVWLNWTGSHWQRDATGEAERRAKDTIMGLYGAASHEQDDGQRQRLVSWARKLDTSRTARAILDWAATDERIAVRPEDLDQDLWALNFTNGTLDLQTGTFRDHRQDDLITFCVLHEYDPDAECPTWNAHLDHFLPDPDVRRQVQRDLGVALTGANLAEVLSIWYGTGANGKTTTCEVLRRVLGDYATEAAPNLLIQRKHEQHPTELADLFGRRLVTSSEIPEGSFLDESKVKALTGGGIQKARYSRRDFFSFPRTWSIVLECNHKPRIKGTDIGIWRRVRVIPWEVSAEGWAGKKPQDEVITTLTAEAPGILRWLVDGLKDWQQDPEWIAERVTVATANYREEQDRLADWINECCEVNPAHSVKFKDLFGSYKLWCEENHVKHLGRDTFGSRLGTAGFMPVFGKGNAATRQGLRLLTPDERSRKDVESDNADRNDTSGEGVKSVNCVPCNALISSHGALPGQDLTDLTHQAEEGDETPVDPDDPSTWLRCTGCGKANPRVTEGGVCDDCEGLQGGA